MAVELRLGKPLNSQARPLDNTIMLCLPFLLLGVTNASRLLDSAGDSLIIGSTGNGDCKIDFILISILWKSEDVGDEGGLLLVDVFLDFVRAGNADCWLLEVSDFPLLLVLASLFLLLLFWFDIKGSVRGGLFLLITACTTIVFLIKLAIFLSFLSAATSIPPGDDIRPPLVMALRSWADCSPLEIRSAVAGVGTLSRILLKKSNDIFIISEYVESLRLYKLIKLS